MNLTEHADFDQWITLAAESSGLPEAFVEKDYYVTEILRTIVTAYPGAVVFKGGTSLSKGWRLLARFSEDLDILIRPERLAPPWTSASQMEKGLKAICATAASVGGLTPVPDRVTVSRPKRRAQFMGYTPHFADLPGIESGILFEPGVGAGDWPTDTRTISSLVAETIRERGMAAEIGTSDLDPFEVETLALGRTFVEKLFVAHAAVERQRTGEETIGRQARHFADLAVLAEQDQVKTLLAAPDDYRSLVVDVDRASRDWYGPRHLPPADLNFARSAVFLSEDVLGPVTTAYDIECGRLFFGSSYPSMTECQERLGGLRHLL